MELLTESGIEPNSVYFTNAVKHFGFQERGKRRIHKKPRILEIRACKSWLREELSVIKPKVIVCLGSSATISVTGKNYKVTEMRGKFVTTKFSSQVFLTVHPASILRALPEDRELQKKLFIRDLRKIAKYINVSA